MKRKLGGVRPIEPQRAPVAATGRSLPVPKRKVGAVRPPEEPGTSIGHRKCEHCEGFIVNGNWLHNHDCPWTVVFWKPPIGVFKSREHAQKWWPCPHRCQVVELPHVYTHHHLCAFWDGSETTPF